MMQCPNTKLCVSGYSQGVQVAHNAANLISSAATAFINSVVLFGDPDDGEAFGQVPASKVSTDCHVGDDICLHGDLVLVPHLTYCLDVGTEAAFAVGKSGL
jgi:cutinase